MSTHTRAKNRRQQRHPGSRGKSHKEDKHRAERRNGSVFVRVPSPVRPSQVRDFAAHGLTGHEFKREAETWTRCADAEEFPDYMEAEARRRSWFTKATQRNGKPVQMKRPAATPVEVLTTTFPPWLSNWTLAELEAGRDPRPTLAKIRNGWVASALARLDGQRFVLGMAFHADTDDLHFDLCTSRQDGDGGRIGAAGLRLVGPWCIGADRQIRAGATISKKKQNRLARDVANFRGRYGQQTTPLDVDLARDLDEIAADAIGPALDPFRAAYAASVPELERAHEAAELAALDAAREEIAQNEKKPAEPLVSEPTFSTERKRTPDLGM